jgi:hypothetical protein
VSGDGFSTTSLTPEKGDIKRVSHRPDKDPSSRHQKRAVAQFRKPGDQGGEEALFERSPGVAGSGWGSAQDLGLLGGELLVGQNSLVVQPGELLELRQLVVHVGACRRCGGLLLSGLGVQ